MTSSPVSLGDGPSTRMLEICKDLVHGKEPEKLSYLNSSDTENKMVHMMSRRVNSSEAKGVFSRLRSFCAKAITKTSSMKVAPGIPHTGVSNEGASSQNDRTSSQRVHNLSDAFLGAMPEARGSPHSALYGTREELLNASSLSTVGSQADRSKARSKAERQKLKKKLNLSKRLAKIWQQVDTRDRVADTIIEGYNTELEILGRKLSVLNEKKKQTLLEYGDLQSRGHSGIVSETLWQCRALKLKLQYYRQTKAMARLAMEIQSFQEKRESLKSTAPVLTSEAKELNTPNTEDESCAANSSESTDKEAKRSSTPPLFRPTEEFPMYLLLPQKLYSIAEETEEEMADYETGGSYDPRTRSSDYCEEYTLPNGQMGWMDFLDIDGIED